MSNEIELRKQQYERFKELFELGYQRRLELEAKGDTRRRSGGKGDDYLTPEERQEFFALGRQLSGFYVKDGYAHCQGRSWKLPDNSPLLNQDEVKSEA
jgi:hypothetical protein